MIIEARCNDCGKRIGYVMLLGDTGLLTDTKYVKKISSQWVSATLLCDECREGQVDLEEMKE